MRSSSVVTGLSLQTKSTFSGGAASTEGKSPTISRIVARALASLSAIASSIYSAVLPSISLMSSSAAIRPLYKKELCKYFKQKY
jgi:hypothetical protein